MKEKQPIQVSRTDIAELLRAWERRHIAAADIQAWAEARYVPGNFEVDDNEDGNSVCAVVLQHLDCLGMNLVTQEDIPLLLDFLSTPNDQFAIGFERWDRITSAIDYKQRRNRLRKIEPYSPFCK